jgi:hypothetical protein
MTYPTTVDALTETSTHVLLQLFNEKTGQSVKRFSDRQSALTRCAAAFGITYTPPAKAKKEEPEEAEEAANKAPKKAKAKKEPKAKAKKEPKAKKEKGEGRPLNFAYDRSPDGVRAPRESSRRAKVVTMLKEGTTLEEVMKSIKWTRRQAVAGIRLVHFMCGYGIADRDGQLSLR